MAIGVGDYLTCRFCGKEIVDDVGDRTEAEALGEDGEAVHTACLKVALDLDEGVHVHSFEARGVRRTGPAFTLSNRATDTEILWRCGDCGAYEVETVPGAWTKEQLGLDDAIETDRKALVPPNFPHAAAGAVGMSKTAAALAARQVEREAHAAREEALCGGPGPAEPPED